MPDNNTSGTWDEVIARNEQELRDLELRIVRSKYRELGVERSGMLALGRRTPLVPEDRPWFLYTPKGQFYGDSLQDVLEQAARHYPEIFEWSHEWNDR